jgi:hypothetical protein
MAKRTLKPRVTTSVGVDPENDPAIEPPALADGRNPAAVMLGRLGGLVGGKARAQVLSPERRSQIARAAAQSRWKKPRPVG